MKTLFLYEEIPDNSFFFELEGDYRHLNGIYINQSTNTRAVDELNEIVYDHDSGELLVEKLHAPTKDWTHFIRCGFIL